MSKYAPFRKATEELEFGIGENLPGKVLATQLPSWIFDLANEPSIKRAEVAKEAGITGAAYIPVLVGSEVVSVLEFFASEMNKPDDELLKVATQIGVQIGRVFERKRAEKKLRESERLATIGISTGKLAHEINNPLSNIYAATQFLEEELVKRKTPADDEILTTVSDVRQEVERLAGLMNDLRTFLVTGREVLELKPINLGDLLKEVLRLEQPGLVGRAICLVEELPASLPPVHADSNKLKQVIMNLIQNSIEAMPGGGTLTVRGYRAGEQVCLEIADTGEGISGDVNVLEQPITTKKQGLGLGLLVVRQIITQHQGTITYSSNLGQGTTFRITLPLKP